MVLSSLSLGLETYMQRCGTCNTVLDYDENTKFDKQMLVHICITCGNVLR
ncbi:hypothetical protein HYU12_01565 [Candidatus Woesearchaeota archaeon]|nr:hypothetical protein [Candidatus Woesearchaeota archaeon]